MTQQTLPQQSLEDMVFETWRACIDSVAEYDSVPIEAIQKLIADTRSIAGDAGWPAVYTHDFLTALARILKAESMGHPTTKQIIRLLEIETEYN